MKLTYRGIAYEIAAPFRSAAHQPQNQSKTKLIYRGQIYYATPREAVAEVFAWDGPTVILRYRGSTYERPLRSPHRSYEPRAINWRYRTAY